MGYVKRAFTSRSYHKVCIWCCFPKRYIIYKGFYFVVMTKLCDTLFLETRSTSHLISYAVIL